MVYRAGLIGCGRIGANAALDTESRLHCHAQAFQHSTRAQLVALCDPDPERLHRAGRRWGVGRLYTDPREMLAKERLDVASICSSTATHPAMFQETLQAGVKGILLEKPVAATPEETAQMLELARQSTAVVSVNYGRRFCPAYQRAMQEIRAGQIGKVLYVHGIYTKGLYNNGTHLLDLLHWALDEPTDLIPSETLSGRADPTCSFRWMGKDGVTAWIQAADYQVFNVFELDFLGTEGRYRFVDQGHRLERYRVENVSSSYGFRQMEAVGRVEATGFHDSIYFAVENLIDCMETGQVPACTLEQGAYVLGLAGRMLEQVV